MGATQSGKGGWARTALLGAALAGWQLYELASFTEGPSRVMLAVHYILLACGLLAVAGALVAYLKNE